MSPCATCEETENLNQQETATEVNVTSGIQAFIPPSPDSMKPSVIIEFCTRCRWLHRATWILTELMLTFPAPTLMSISLVPLDSPETGGRFRIWLLSENETALVWDRKTEGGFPELKDLKQRVRDRVDPGRRLGHSDRHTKREL